MANKISERIDDIIESYDSIDELVTLRIDGCHVVTFKFPEDIVTTQDKRNVVMMSLDEYNSLMKQVRNAKYIEHLHEGLAQIEAGKGAVHELIEDDE